MRHGLTDGLRLLARVPEHDLLVGRAVHEDAGCPAALDLRGADFQPIEERGDSTVQLFHRLVCDCHAGKHAVLLDEVPAVAENDPLTLTCRSLA